MYLLQIILGLTSFFALKTRIHISEGSFFQSLLSSKGEEITSIDKIPFSPDWLILLFILQVILIAWLKLYYPTRLKLLTNSYFNNRFIDQLTREEKSAGIYNWVVELLYFLGISTFVYISNRYFSFFDINLAGGLEFTVISLSLLLFVLLKSLIMRVMAWLFDMESKFGDIHFYRFLNHSLLSFALFPLAVMCTFYPPHNLIWLYIGWGIFGLAFFHRLLRSVVRFSSYNSFSFKYIILYICALEILPLAVLVKTSFNNLTASGM